MKEDKISTVPFAFEGLTWHCLTVTFRAKKSTASMKNHPISVIQAIAKAVSGRAFSIPTPGTHDVPVFHITDKRHTFKLEPGEVFNVKFLFFNQGTAFLQSWKQHLVTYMSKPVHCHALELGTAGEVEEWTPAGLMSRFGSLPAQGELCLEFLTPLPFKREKGKSRVFISRERFIRLFEKRLSLLFGKKVVYDGSNDDFFLLPLYWKYTEIKHPSKSRPGTNQLINGVVGRLYIKGRWPGLLPLLIAGSQFHLGAKRSNSQGYYRILSNTPAYFSPPFPEANTVRSVIRDVIDRYDHVMETLSKEEHYPFDENEYARQLCLEIKENQYLPEPNIAFRISNRNKNNRIVEQLSFKDLVVSQYLRKTIYRIMDNTFDEESIGCRRGLSREKASAKITAAVNQGFHYVVEAGLEDFFPAIPIARLERLLEFCLLPNKDTLLNNLLKKIIENGYILDGRYHQRLNGLPTGNPLSPLLANLYLDRFDKQVKALDIKVIRYTEDFFILCRSPRQAESLLSRARGFPAEIGKMIKEGKTSVKPVTGRFQFSIVPAVDPFKQPLYITEPHLKLSVNGDSLAVKRGREIIDSIPFHRIREIDVKKKALFTTALIHRCLENKIPLNLALDSGFHVAAIK